MAGPPANGTGNLTELQAAFRRVLQSGLADLPEYGYDEEDVGRPGSPEEDIIALERNDPRAADFRNYLRTWFGKVPWSYIRRHEMFAWIHWSIFNAPFTSFDVLPPARQKVLLEVLQLIEKRAGASIPEGSNPKAKPLLLTLDPVSVTLRPFIWYAGVALSNYYQRRHYETQWNATVSTYKGLECVGYFRLYQLCVNTVSTGISCAFRTAGLLRRALALWFSCMVSASACRSTKCSSRICFVPLRTGQSSCLFSRMSAKRYFTRTISSP